MEQIPVFKPLIEQEEIQAAVESLQLGWLGMGGYVGKFEEELKNFIGADDRYVVAVNTGHSALHLAMMLIGLQPGDEVITPSFNNIADFQAILAVGANPVFCDIREDTLCIDVLKAEELINPKTKAIISMDYDCCLADHEAVADLANRYKIRVIHDAAHSFGSYYKSQKIGTFSDLCMFSFDPVKTITCIDGGALVVKTQEEVEILHEMRLIGMGQPASVMYGNQRAWTYDVNRLGFRYHMANLHAAIGLSQLSKMPEITKSRQKACCLYNTLLSGVEHIKTPNSDFTDVTPFLYYIRVPADDRQALRDWLKKHGIDTGIHWQPGHWFSLLSNARQGDLSVTNLIGSQILSLPLHSMMKEQEVEYIANMIVDFFKTKSNV
ncbi:DegT/DnrJ/EryC1/StrS family aminotransferase [Spirulina subsalsa]|uniref:DegT/DnrJ/EryC1/StrS family aminotransferase n=1 Tax=Spirulina subsalsa TaxID=54311 RepID=UPI000C1FD62A|nr:DegT/DnrJ/EryC1/StrS family aminotransferase [Spirulina subsalsa]